MGINKKVPVNSHDGGARDPSRRFVDPPALLFGMIPVKGFIDKSRRKQKK